MPREFAPLGLRSERKQVGSVPEEGACQSQPVGDCVTGGAACLPRARPRVAGKYLFVDDHKLYVKGVTYGPFRPGERDCAYGSRNTVAADLQAMAAHGINAIRVYTVPPDWLLDLAWQHGLRVMVGIPWEQHVAFLDDVALRRRIERRVRAGVAACAGHPAILCYAIGNEIPAPIVRWYGRAPVERYLKRLYEAAKEEDPGSLVTYVNYPTTEYLQLPFLDFYCFNVYLESKDRLTTYLAKLQNLEDDRPLVMAEVGLDSLRNGEEGQSRSLDWQLRTVFASGCAGAFVFSWTDEWHRGGHDIEDWAFGLTTRDRRPKPALASVGRALRDVPVSNHCAWPKVSVVVCVYNGSRTLRESLEGLTRLEYPEYEIIVVNDGSTDETAEIAGSFDVRLINLANGGLSNARNVGMQAATGELVAYIDDDAYPDPHWLTHVAHTFMNTDHAGVGGPNLPPADDGQIAECIANAPGGPSHVLVSDSDVEHIPGCNMCFRRNALLSIGGFDAQFRIAGDDVDLCWRLQEQGMTLGFNPAAVVWHHRRSSVRAYLKQQLNYGKAEAILEGKWPEKYNSVGHVRWKGRLYGQGKAVPLLTRRSRIYHGVWGSGPFQSIYGGAPGVLRVLSLMPEWYLLIAALVILTISSIGSPAIWLSASMLAVAVAVSILQAGLNAVRAPLRRAPAGRLERMKQRLVIAYLHLAQPAVRLVGRLRYGLTPWRRRLRRRYVIPRRRTVVVWSERSRSPQEWLSNLQAAVRGLGGLVFPGGAYDRWDLELRGGIMGTVRVLVAVEEHGDGKQLLRFRVWPRVAPFGAILVLLLAVLAVAAGASGFWGPCSALGTAALIMGIGTLGDCACATGTFLEAVESKRT
ncbi:MAG: glycosyltransferase [Planctomycetota bacterium]|jgi:GT2 family glycosyltransferase